MDLSKRSSVDEDEEILFVFSPSQNLYCPICHELFNNPIITKECSHSFCQTCIFQIEVNGNVIVPMVAESNTIGKEAHCPLCRHMIDLKQVHPNLVLNQLVKDLPIHCKWEINGCNTHIALGNRVSHQLNCDYRPFNCIHQQRGCLFTGPKKDLENHLKICVYEQLKGYILLTENTLSDMRHQLEMQAAEINELKRKLAQGPTPISQDSLVPEVKSGKVEVEENSKENSIEEQLPAVEPQPYSPRSEKQKWNVPSIQCQQTIVGHNRGVTSLKYCTKNQYLFSGSHDCTVRVWAQIDNEGSRQFSCIQVLNAHQFTVWSIVVSEDGHFLYSGAADGLIVCWDLHSFTNVKQVMHGGKVYSLELIGNKLYSAGSDKKIKVWSSHSLDCVKQINAHTESIWQLYHHNNLLYSCSDDKTVKVWDLATHERIYTIAQDSKILSVGVGNGFICTGSDDCKIKIWNAQTYEHLITLTEHNWEVWQLHIEDGLLFSGSFDHLVKVWDLSTFGCIATLSGHKGYVHALAIGDKHLYSGSGDKTIKEWFASQVE